MRTVLLAGLTVVACAGLATQAVADIKIKTDVRTYAIAGQTGEDLLSQMDRKGPKHGFLTRAIAQTRYAINWDVAWKSDGQGCRVEKASARVDITYSYPRVTSKMSPALKARWIAFLRGVKRHEEMHGTIARRMVAAAEKSVLAVSVKRDPNCRAARAEVKRRVSATYAKFETDQRQFDAAEHRDGGNVAKLVARLTR